MQLYRPIDLCLYMQSVSQEFIATFTQVKQRATCIIRCWCTQAQSTGRSLAKLSLWVETHAAILPWELRVTHSQSLGHQKPPARSWAIPMQLSIVFPTWLTESASEIWDQYHRKMYLLPGFQGKKKKIRTIKYPEMSKCSLAHQEETYGILPSCPSFSWDS